MGRYKQSGFQGFWNHSGRLLGEWNQTLGQPLGDNHDLPDRTVKPHQQGWMECFMS